MRIVTISLDDETWAIHEAVPKGQKSRLYRQYLRERAEIMASGPVLGPQGAKEAEQAIRIAERSLGA